ncbi:hypothetical protein CPB97_002611 [Podila verticillata]|nr:hypothetical protein CPB97_002611 [Podila verticillata]
MTDNSKQKTAESSGPSSDPSSLPSQPSPSDPPMTPQSSMNATNFTAHSPTGAPKDQNEAATPITNDSKAGSDRPRPSQPSDEASMKLADFDELKARLEAHREHSVQTFHAISGVLDNIHAEVQYIYSEFLTQQYNSIEGELDRLHEESNRRLREQERLQQQLAQFLATMKKAFSIFE